MFPSAFENAVRIFLIVSFSSAFSSQEMVHTSAVAALKDTIVPVSLRLSHLLLLTLSAVGDRNWRAVCGDETMQQTDSTPSAAV
jgi:hypothetical protein